MKISLQIVFGTILISTVNSLAVSDYAAREIDDLNARQMSSYTLLGCYLDGNPRVLREGAPSNPVAVSYEYCADYCSAAGYSLAGVENGFECYCGNALLYNYGSGVCNELCSGSATNTCGASGNIQIYTTGVGSYTTGPTSVLVSYNSWAVTECWQDGNSGRVLPSVPSSNPSSQTMTVETCLDACAADGYNSAGVEWGQ